MTNQHFVFQPGTWLGEGKINFSESSSTLHFYTRWIVKKLSDGNEAGKFECIQKVEMQGSDEQIENQFHFSNIQRDVFKVRLENDLVGAVEGKGILEPKKIAWEFRDHRKNFEGFEVYELQEDGDYLFHAEYLSQDHIRSIIEGRIWKKAKK